MIEGIDVSHHQGAVDWQAAAASGAVFAFIKATEGANTQDARFTANWEKAKSAGIIRGAYHFFHPLTSVDAQVTNFCSTVGTLGADDLPPVLDLEETSSGNDEWDQVPMSERVPLAVAWLEAVAKTLDRKAIVYTRRGFVAAKFGTAAELATYPLWVAHYTEAAQPAIPAPWVAWTFWQYSETGKVPGVLGATDRNRFNGSRADLAGWIGTI